jgi:hypothetical protein
LRTLAGATVVVASIAVGYIVRQLERPAPFPTVTIESRFLPDPDGKRTEYLDAVKVVVPSTANAQVSAGLARWVENGVFVVDDSGQLYQGWGTAIAHNLQPQRELQAGKTYSISSWYKDVADKGDRKPWHASLQQLSRTEKGAYITVYHDSGNGEPDA